MQCFFILGMPFGKTQVLFDVVDIPLYDSAYFVGIIPFLCPADSAELSPQILFRIKIDHAAAFRGSATVCATTFPVHLLCGRIVNPFRQRADEFVSCGAVFQLEYSGFRVPAVR